MGAGHDQVAEEVARRLRVRGHDAHVVDLLTVLPAGIGVGLRDGYALMLRRAPWLYDLIYRVFFIPRERGQPSTSPLVALAGRRLAPVLAAYRPDAVVSTFHLAGQVVGRLRTRGRLDVPAAVVVTEAVAHALWLSPGNDLYLTLFPALAERVRARTGADVLAPGPVVDPRFRAGGGDRAQVRHGLGLRAGEDAVIVSTGSWGVGDAAIVATALAARAGVRPVVVCGRNDDLRRSIDGIHGCIALGWREDLPDLLGAAAVLVDNAGGSMCLEAFAAGVPVVAYRPIPGHGGPAVRALADAGLLRLSGDDPSALRAAVDAVRPGGADRDGQIRAGRAIFAGDPVDALLQWMTRHAVR